MDYNQERKAKDMKQFLDYQMPNFIEKVNGSNDFTKFVDKATRNGLPQVLVFTSKPKTSSLTKYLSTEFRRRLLIAEIHPSKNNKELMEKYKVTDLPALIVIPPSSADDAETVQPIRYDGDGFTRNKLHSFLSNYALKEKVLPKKRKKEKAEATGKDHSEF